MNGVSIIEVKVNSEGDLEVWVLRERHADGGSYWHAATVSKDLLADASASVTTKEGGR